MARIDVPVTELRRVVGDSNVLTDADQLRSFGTDWTGRFAGYSTAVVRPRSTAETAEVVKILNHAQLPIVPQGGNTGLVGGGVPLNGEVLLSTVRMNTVGAVDISSRQITAGAGATLAQVNDAGREGALMLGVEIASVETATVGGAISTNAGGVRMLRYGSMARQVLGVEAVLADGSIISHLAGLTKDNTGYRLHELLSGAEGTLAVITQARLRLIKRPSVHSTAFVGLESVHAAVEVASRLITAVPGLEVVELVLPDGLHLVEKHLTVRSPIRTECAAYLLIEAGGDVDVTDAIVAALGDVPERPIAIAMDEPSRRGLWAVRERHTEAISGEGIPQKLDVSVPMHSYASFVDEVPALIASIAPSARVIMFGHIADGNVHVNVLGVPSGIDVEGPVFELVAAFGGSISAEHGIGTAKKPWLNLNRSAAEIAAGIAIKNALDPRRILNPNAIYPG